MQKPAEMSDDDLMQEIVDTFREGRATDRWDRSRLREMSAEAVKRGLMGRKTTKELEQYP